MPANSTYFANDGAAYELFLGRWTKQIAPPLLDFAQFPPAGAFLDVGTGTGSLAFAMAARWPDRRIAGIDTAAPYIAYARSRANGCRPAFAIGDAARLPHDGASFAGVAAQLVLNFVPQPHLAVGEMRRV